MIVFLLAGVLGMQMPSMARGAAPPDLAQVEGAGVYEFACLGCAGTIIVATGASLGGLLVGGLFFPEAYAGCAYLCYRAYM